MIHWLVQCAGGYSETWRNTRVVSRVQEEHIGENVALTRIGSAPESVGSLDVRDGAHGALCRAGPPPAEDGGCLRVPQGHRGHPEGETTTPSWRSWARCRTIYSWRRRTPRADRIPCQHSTSWVTHQLVYHSSHNPSSVETKIRVPSGELTFSFAKALLKLMFLFPKVGSPNKSYLCYHFKHFATPPFLSLEWLWEQE